MAKICPPAQPHTVAMYALVAPNSFATQTVHDVISNAPGAPVGSRMRVDPPYPSCILRANFPISVDPAFTRTSSVVRDDLAIAGQTATVDITVLNGGVKVAYDLSWSANRANKCAGASDGCGGYCANNWDGCGGTCPACCARCSPP